MNMTGEEEKQHHSNKPKQLLEKKDKELIMLSSTV